MVILIPVQSLPELSSAPFCTMAITIITTNGTTAGITSRAGWAEGAIIVTVTGIIGAGGRISRDITTEGTAITGTTGNLVQITASVRML